MATSPATNVVSLDAHARARARLTPQESAGVLTGCRDLAVGRLAQALVVMLDRVEDELFDLAERAGEHDAQNTFLDARVHARKHRGNIETTFHRQFLACFNARVKGEPAAAPAAAVPAALSLVDDETLEQTLAVQAMAGRLRSACEGELGALSHRMAFLLSRPELTDEANPVSPEAVCGALKDACDQIAADWKVRLALLRALEAHVAGELQGVYRELNAHLVELQILPDARPAFRRNPAAAPRAPSRWAPASAAPADVHAVLAGLLGALSAPGAAMAAAGGTAAVTPATRGFVQSLTGLQQPGPAGAGDAQALANVIRALGASPQSAALPAVDAMTIDIVAMLFDFIFEDRQIPAAVKALLGRLQIPTLKVALLDRAFFSSRSHPARQLLDRLARAAIGLDESSSRGEATLAKLEHVVGRVLAEFDDDLGLFATLAAEMEAFLAQQDEAEEAIATRTARLVEERERREIAGILAEEEVDRRLAARDWVPEPVRAMLEDVWARALADAHLAHGEGSQAWQAMLATADELLWSVEPKADAADRRRLVAGIPALVASLQAGMARAGVGDPARDVFFGMLVDCHAQAVKAGLRGMPLPGRSSAQEPAPAAPFAAPSLEREMFPAGDIQVEEIRLRSPRGATPVRNVFTRTGIWTHVKRYTWVEFRREGSAPIRARLTWISPAKGIYLFTNSTASVAISVSPEALAEQMRRREARIVDDSPLVDRAVDAMVANLRERAA